MPARAVAALAALVGAFGVVAQLGLLIQDFLADGKTVAAAVWRFLVYFSILTNMAIVLVGGAMALAPRSALAGPRVRMAAATAIAIVGIVFAVALRSTMATEGLRAVASHALHDVVPPLFLLAWVLSDHGELGWTDALWALIAPTVYTVYGLARGLAENWYPYWFLDLDALSFGAFLTNAALIVAGFLAIAGLFVAADKGLGRLGRQRAASTAYGSGS